MSRDCAVLPPLIHAPLTATGYSQTGGAPAAGRAFGAGRRISRQQRGNPAPIGMLRHSQGASWHQHLGRDGWEGLPLARTCGAAAPARNTGMAQNASVAQAHHADQAGKGG